MYEVLSNITAATQWFGCLKASSGIHYSTEFKTGQVFTIRSLEIERDLLLIHQWVHAPAALRYWNMEGSVAELRTFYEKVLGLAYCHSFIGFINGEPVCQVDAYDPEQDHLGQLYPVMDGDIGIHLLMGNRTLNISNLSAKIVIAFCNWFFEAQALSRVVVEPDHNNRAANWLLHLLQFEFLGKIEMPEKTANLFVMSKERFELIRQV